MKCKHCGKKIGLFATHHIEGAYAGKMRCDPADSGLPYGYNAEPEGEACGPICAGYEGHNA